MNALLQRRVGEARAEIGELELCEGGAMKVKRVPMTKVERARKRAEEERQAINRLRELVEEPPSPLDRLLEALGRPPTLEQRLKEIGRSVLQAYEKFSQATKGKNG